MGSIDTRKAVRIKQLDGIHELFRFKSIEYVRGLADESKGAQRNVYEALALFKEAPNPSYITGYQDPKYARGRELIKKAIEDGNVDAWRLLLYVETGLSVKVKPACEMPLEEIFKKLYELTGDGEIPPILENFSDVHMAYLLKYEDKRYSLACEDYSPSTYGGSHDESYYENLKYHEGQNNNK